MTYQPQFAFPDRGSILPSPAEQFPIGAYECLTCGLSGIEERIARRLV